MSALGSAARAAGRALLALGSPLAVATAGAPVLAGLLWGALATGVDPARSLEAVSLRAWAAGLALTLVAGMARAVVARSAPDALACAALLAGVGQLAAASALRFQGIAVPGVGEPEPPWRDVDAGPLAARPAVEVQDVAGGRVRLRVDGQAAELAPGAAVGLGRYAVRVRSVAPAPAFEITRPGGGVEGSGLFKLGTDGREFLQVGILPHRLYLTRAEGAREGEAADRAPARLRLRAFRGKLAVFDGVVAKDEPTTFDGVGFAYGDGSAWAEVEVRRAVPRTLAAMAAGLAVAAAVVALRRRARREKPA